MIDDALFRRRLERSGLRVFPPAGPVPDQAGDPGDGDAVLETLLAERTGYSARMTESEHSPVESARPELGRRDSPDTIRPDTDANEEPDHKLPADEQQQPPPPPPERPAEG